MHLTISSRAISMTPWYQWVLWLNNQNENTRLIQEEDSKRWRTRNSKLTRNRCIVLARRLCCTCHHLSRKAPLGAGAGDLHLRICLRLEMQIWSLQMLRTSRLRPLAQLQRLGCPHSSQLFADHRNWPTWSHWHPTALRFWLALEASFSNDQRISTF